MTDNAQHSSQTNEHYTPGLIVELCRRVIGKPFDLDPASNDRYAPTIGASTYYTEEQDGLSQPWFGNVWLNPPGGKAPVKHQNLTKSNSALWWHFLSLHYLAGNVNSSFFLGFSLEQLQSIQLVKNVQAHPLQYPTVFFKRRIKFVKRDLTIGKGPSHANFLTFLPPKDPERMGYYKRLFAEHLGEQGQLINV